METGRDAAQEGLVFKTSCSFGNCSHFCSQNVMEAHCSGFFFRKKNSCKNKKLCLTHLSSESCVGRRTQFHLHHVHCAFASHLFTHWQQQTDLQRSKNKTLSTAEIYKLLSLHLHVFVHLSVKRSFLHQSLSPMEEPSISLCLYTCLDPFVSSVDSLSPSVSASVCLFTSLSPSICLSSGLVLHLLLSVCLAFHQSLSMFTTVYPSLTICLHLHLFFSSTDCLSVCISVFVHLSLSISLEPSVVRWCFTQQRSVKIFYIL